MKFFKDKILGSDLGLLLSLGSIGGYGLYYLYAQGFNQYYGLPSSYVDLNIPNLALTIITICLAMIFILSSFQLIVVLLNELSFLFKYRKKFKYVLLSLCWSIIILFFVGEIFNFFSDNQEFYLNIAICISAAFLAWHIPEKKYPSMVIMFLCFGFLLAALSIGEHIAMNKEDYFVLEQKNKKYAVINNYKDKIIIAPIDIKKRTIISKFQLIEMKSDKDNKIELVLMNTGKLKVKKYGD